MPTGLETNDGLSWNSARTHPALVASNAVAGDEIWVAAGKYSGLTVQLPAGVRLLGGFQGVELSAAERSTNAALTCLETTTAEPVVQVSNNGSSTTMVSGLTLQAAANPEATGRGLVALGGKLEIAGCIFRKFKAPAGFDDPGAALLVTNASLLLVGNEFSDNLATSLSRETGSYGGAVGCVAVSPCVIRSNVFRSNRAIGASAVSLKHCRGDFERNWLVNNLGGTSSNVFGIPGAIELYRTAMSVRANRFCFNRGGMGSAMFVFDSLDGQTNRISFNLFVGNSSGVGLTGEQATIRGWGLPEGGVKLLILNNTFVGNSSSFAGDGYGCAVQAFGEVTLVNNLFACHHSGSWLGKITNAFHNVFLEGDQAVGPYHQQVGRHEAFADAEFRHGWKALDFHLSPHAVSRGYADPSWVDADALDLMGRPARHPDGTADAGAIGYVEAPPVPPAPQIVFVRPDGDDAAAGDSWASALRSLSAAVARVNYLRPIEVWLAAGSYLGLPPASELPPTVMLRGSFSGHETQADQRAHRGELSSTLFRPSPIDPVLSLRANGPWNEIEGLILSGAGTALTNDSRPALRAFGSWPHIHHCRFESQQGKSMAAALLTSGGLVEGCRFEGNRVATVGSVMQLGSAVFCGNVISGNEAVGTSSTLCQFSLECVVGYNLWISNRVTGTAREMVRYSPGATDPRLGFFHNTLVDNFVEATNSLLLNVQDRGPFRANLIAHNRGRIILNTTAVDNLFFGNTPELPTSTQPLSQNLFADPLLGPERWRPARTSSARDAVSAPQMEGSLTDFDGEGAWLGRAPDVGADEMLPEHPLAARIAQATVQMESRPASLQGVFRNWEDTCPDCYKRQFRRGLDELVLDLVPQETCPDIACTGEMQAVDYPFDFGSAIPGFHSLNVQADGVRLRTVSLWVRPPVTGYLKVATAPNGPEVEWLRHPGVPALLQGSLDLSEWTTIRANWVGGLLTGHTNEHWFFRLISQ